jgi:tetratricopeptide (TPR) repeat protein
MIQAEGREDIYHAPEWQELVQALAYQLFLLPDETSHVKASELVLLAYHKTGQAEEIVGFLQELAQRQPGNTVGDSTREAAKQLIQYIEADLGSEEFLAAANFFLEKEAHEPVLTPDLLQHLYHKRGVTRLLLNEPGVAIEDLNHALELAPNNAWIYANRGSAHLKIDENQQAIKDLDYALSWLPMRLEFIAYEDLPTSRLVTRSKLSQT